MRGSLLHAGGSPYAVIAILDTLKTIKPDVSTIAFGQSLSTATLLLVRLLSSGELVTNTIMIATSCRDTVVFAALLMSAALRRCSRVIVRLYHVGCSSHRIRG